MTLLQTSLLYNEYEAMERFGVAEPQFYALPRDVRARMVAKLLIDSFMNVYRQWEGRPRGK